MIGPGSDKKATLHQFFLFVSSSLFESRHFAFILRRRRGHHGQRRRGGRGAHGDPLGDLFRGVRIFISLCEVITIGHFQVGDLLQPVAQLVGDVTRDLHKLVDPKVDQYHYHHHHHQQSRHHNRCNHHPRPAKAGRLYDGSSHQHHQ